MDTDESVKTCVVIGLAAFKPDTAEEYIHFIALWQHKHVGVCCDNQGAGPVETVEYVAETATTGCRE